MSTISVGVRLPAHLHDMLVAYAAKAQTSKSEVIVTALVNYFNNPEDVPLSIKVADLEKRIVALETKAAE
ncbi:MAG: hypothetical protein QNJ54_34375 [Prochloraceae cyanobacterium]|nr:hypothetical protein [Prochloraceae cyanobacterium]